MPHNLGWIQQPTAVEEHLGPTLLNGQGNSEPSRHPTKNSRLGSVDTVDIEV